jgi:glycosyltransferase involved in cell wall biosynthesis
MQLTIFTPTYNRGYLLDKLFQSLCRQTVKLFEWIIIDDASDDDTEKIVNEFINEECGFAIRYYKQKHGGKHRALNYGYKIANGDFFFCVDSDDYICDNAVELILSWINQIENSEDIVAVAGLRISTNGKIWGGIPDMRGKEYIDAGNFERDGYNLGGDKAEVYRTSILKKYLFPEFEGEFFVTEAVTGDAIAAEGYKIRWFNVPIYVSEYLEDGLTKSGANQYQGHINNYQGYCYYVSQCIHIKPKVIRLQNFWEYNKTGRYMKNNMKKRADDIGISLCRYIWYYIISAFKAVYDRVKNG